MSVNELTEAQFEISKKQNKNRPNNLASNLIQEKKEKKIEVDIRTNT